MTPTDENPRNDPAAPVPRAACARVQGRLAELLDRGLGALDAARDEGHLEACAACAAEHGAWRTLLGRAREAETKTAVEGLETALAGLEGRLAGRAPAPRRPEPVRTFALRAVASRVALPLLAAAAAVAALMVLDQGGIRLEGPSRELGRSILSEVRPTLPSWIGLVEGEGAPRADR